VKSCIISYFANTSF